jgi:hypothetical protein
MKVYNNSGQVVEIDSVPVPSGGGGVNEWTAYTLNFGSGKPVYDKDFTITNATVTANSKIAVAMDLADEAWQWDTAIFTVVAGSGSFSLNCEVIPGPVSGNRLIEYQVTN